MSVEAPARPPDVVVVGGGPVGLSVALALAARQIDVALIARRQLYGDNRTTALLGASVQFLRNLDVWQRCHDNAAALREMRLVDDTGRLIRAPQVSFSASEIGLEAFGYNLDNRMLLRALEERAAELPNLTRIDDEADLIDLEDDAVRIRCLNGTSIAAKLLIGADGQRSLCRVFAGITTRRRDLQQTALTFNVTHTRPHLDRSTEFHTSDGPCVLVPLPGNRSSVVWVTTPARAKELRELDEAAFSLAIEQQAHSILGRMQVGPERHMFPLAIETPSNFAAKRVALVGEAAHVLPPIGAQGLNLGLRDAADVAAIFGEAIAAGDDPGVAPALSRFDRARRADVVSRTLVIDAANRSLLSDFLPLQSLRAAGLHLLNHAGPLRRVAMREGLAPFWRRRNNEINEPAIDLS